ncbi:MAG TPA: ABC transporter ATP-binding protein [Lichenihabitans sp.]|jgi:putative spermidine/putrescine transport system ATP-binding protein|nr:ABC transporter ATP-binding protein [Lichenihabitans sp.]
MGSPSAHFEELRLEGVGRRFGHLDALSGIDLIIRRGEFVALLGPSGCGKSTTLNCIAGLLPISAGRILLDGRRIDELRPEERGFGMVFQNYALFPHMSVRQNIGFGLKMRRTPSAEAARRVEAAIRLVHLEGQERKLPGQMSGGQQQRVAIARAVVIEPPLVLMDEPLSNLDAKLRLEMRAEIRRIHNELGATTIYVTHDQDEALSMADRVVVLKDGAIRQVGRPQEVHDRPADIDVAEFMGFRNRLLGTWEAGPALSFRVGSQAVAGLSRGADVRPGRAVALMRPDDVTVAAHGDALSAHIEAIEYRGQGYIGTARLDGGLVLQFRTERPIAAGEPVRLAPDPDRVLIFPSD